MLDQEDEGTRIGVWTALAVVFVVVIGLIGGLVVRQMHGKTAAAPVAAVAMSGAASAPAGEFVDAPGEGDLAGAIYFAVGQAALPDGSDPMVFKVVMAVQEDGKRRIVLSGYHDATGAADVNARIARDRALAVRAALLAEGVPAERIVLRKPAVALGDAEPIEARRVDILLVE